MWGLFLGLLILFEAIADILAKEYQIRSKWIFFVAAICAYCIGNMAWLISLRDGAELSRGAMIFSVASATFAVLVGTFYFKESLTKGEIAGVILGLIAIALLVWE